MRIAVTAENNLGLESTVCEHFGHSPYFVLVDVDDGLVAGTSAVANPFYDNHQPGQVPAFIHSQNAGVIVSGGMGANAIAYFGQYGIEVATGATGTVRSAVEQYLRGELGRGSSCSGGHHHH
jgi:predicted Fe-Mo cluster-binding NifX family protein